MKQYSPQDRHNKNAGDASAASETATPHFRRRWIALILCGWLLLGLIPSGLAFVGTYAALADSRIASVAGTIGDSFGLANSFFSGAALLFIVWSLRLQQHESRENTKSQTAQARLMKEAASLTAINHIYVHYSNDYGQHSAYGLLASVASGHRRWAIRESFGSVDDLFARDRVTQVLNECRELASWLKNPVAGPTYMQQIGKLTASVLVDARAPASFRKTLWPVYELIRASPKEVCEGGNDQFSNFVLLAKEAVGAWETKAGEEITKLTAGW